MKTIKKAITAMLMLACVLAYAQDIVYQNADSIRLPLNNPARTLPGIASAPGQGGNLGWNAPWPDTTERWYCMNPAKSEVRLEENGFKVKTEVNLKNGSLVTNDGKVVEQNGPSIQLQLGECISGDGEIAP